MSDSTHPTDLTDYVDDTTTESASSSNPESGADPQPEGPTGPVRTQPTDGISDAGACRITDHDLWIANAEAVEPAMLDTLNLDPEYVVSVNRDRTAVTTDHYQLRDGYINPYDEFAAAVDATRDRITQDGMVIVNCAAGISRSATVIATALAAAESRAFAAVVEEIRETRQYARPNQKLVISACHYLSDCDDRSPELRDIDRQRASEAAGIIVDEIGLDADEKSRFDAALDALGVDNPRR